MPERLFPHSQTIHIITIFGESVVLMSGMVEVALGCRASEFGEYTVPTVKTYDDNQKSEHIFYVLLKKS